VNLAETDPLATVGDPLAIGVGRGSNRHLLEIETKNQKFLET